MDANLQLGSGIDVIDEASSLAGVDMFLTGWVSTASCPSTELDLLRDFVVGGGTLIAPTDDDSNRNARYN